MDPLRVEAYLRSLCSVLDFDIGELWCARKIPGQSPILKFIQLYTSESYNDFHSLLVQPEEHHSSDEEKHRFSPIICRGVCDGGQIVWANTRVSEGLTGRSDVPLNTAVGVPIGSIGYDLYILVLFAVRLNPMSANAIQYLCTVCNAIISPYSAGETCSGFLKASNSNGVSNEVVITAANTNNFVGLWDMSELIKKYSSAVEFHLLPIEKLQMFFDCQEILLFCDVFHGFKLIREDNIFKDRNQEMGDGFRRSRTESFSSESSHTWMHGMELRSISAPLFDRVQSVNGDENQTINSQRSGISNIFSSNQSFSIDFLPSDNGMYDNSSSIVKDNRHQSPSCKNEADFAAVLNVYAHMTYKLLQERFHDFMVSILGMTVFDGAELWLLSPTADADSEQSRVLDSGDGNILMLVAAAYRSTVMKNWVVSSGSLCLRAGLDVPGRCIASAQPVWDDKYGLLADNNAPGSAHPRSSLATNLGIKTAFSVPLPGFQGQGSCGVISFYSSKMSFGPEALMMTLIEKSAQLITAEQSLVMAEVESIQHVPQLTLSKWFESNSNEPEPLVPPEVAQSSCQNQEPSQWSNTAAQSSMYSLQKSGIINDQQLQYTVNGSSTQYSYQQCSNYNQSSSEGGGTRGLRTSMLLPQITNTNTTHPIAVQDNAIATPSAKYSFKNYGKKLEQCKTLLSARHQKEKFLTVSPFSSAVKPIAIATTESEKTPVTENVKKRKSSSNDSLGSSSGSCTTSASKENSDLSDDINAALALDNFKKGRLLSPSGTYDGGGLIRFGDDPNEVKERMRRAVAVTAVLSLHSAVKLQDSGIEMVDPQIHQQIFPANSLLSLREMAAREERIGNMNICQPSRSRFSQLPGGQLIYSDHANAHHAAVAKVDGEPVPAITEGSHFNDGAVVKLEDGFDGSLTNSRKCHAQGCSKCAQGATKFCISHGGGKRCTHPNCDRGARDKFFCAAHGGGKRCSIGGCDKSAVGGSNLCTAHGGGKRCAMEGCNKSSQSSTNFCVRHGGGRSCKMDGCTKVARGRTDYCAAHGGGVRCMADKCSKLAVSSQKMCRYHTNNLSRLHT